MPLYEYVCTETGEVIEHVCKFEDRPKELISSAGRRAVRQEVHLVALTPNRWGDTNMYFNRGLGAWVNGQKDVDRICKERGIIPESDLPQHYVTDNFEKWQKREAHMDKRADELDDLANKHLGGEDYNPDNPHHQQAFTRVYEEWMPAKPTLNGAYDAEID
jgi:hypothetical protein